MVGSDGSSVARASTWTRVRALFASNGKPLLWRVVVAVGVGMLLGQAVGRLLGFEQRSAAVGLVAAFVAAAGSVGSRRLATWMSVRAAVVVGIAVVAGIDTTGYPLASAVAMAVVAFGTSLATASRPVGYLLAMLASYAHLIASALGVIARDTAGTDLGRSILVASTGGVVGMLFTLVWSASMERIRPVASTPLPSSPLPAMWHALRTFDAPARHRVRRALALGCAMYLFQRIGTRDAFWVLFAAFAVLLPNGRSTLGKAVVRVGGTLLGCAACAAVAFLLPRELATVLGFVCLLVAIAYAQRSSALCAAWMGAGTAVLAGLAVGQAAYWAERRVIDTVYGVLVAVVVGYLPWPGDRARLRPPPELGGGASVTPAGAAHQG